MIKIKNAFFLAIAIMVVSLAGCKKDGDPAVRPTVISTSPSGNAVGVATSSNVLATFSVPMNPASITSSVFTVMKGTSAIAGEVSYTGTTASFNPTNDLEGNTLYTATITTGAKNVANDALLSNYVFSFTTGAAPDVAAPTVSLLDPLNNATGVLISKALVITFSEAMDPTTITSSSFTLKQGTANVAGVVTYSGLKGTFTPSANLSYGLSYTASIAITAKDASGNALVAASTWSFMTEAAPDTSAPLVSSTIPASNATGVSLTNSIKAIFSEPMSPLTITSSTFTVSQGANLVAGTVTYSGVTATFNPSNSLAVSTVYTATITTGAKDLAGNALTANKSWNFTTSASTLSAVDLGAAGNYVILAKTAINNNPTSAVTGDLGLSPAATSFITGFALTNATGYATASQVTGQIFAADMAPPTSTNLTTAVENMITAYNDAAGRPTPSFLELNTGNIGGLTLTPGLYKWTSTVTLPSNVTISGGANDVWIFQISGDLTMSSAVNITLTGGAQAKNIFWQIAGQATLGATSHFEGIILSKTGITFQTGASINGRLLAQTAVILDANTVTKPQ